MYNRTVNNTVVWLFIIYNVIIFIVACSLSIFSEDSVGMENGVRDDNGFNPPPYSTGYGPPTHHPMGYEVSGLGPGPPAM